ncbi:MAG TPA: DUF192 domain-containing protein [Candidatus Paceibacterota bacterium]
MNLGKPATIFVLVLIVLGSFVFFHQSNKIVGVEMGGKTFSIEVARTNSERAKGLSGHLPLLDDQGMLFVFPKPDKYGFWMKDMNFSIDIIWIDANFKIVHIENSLPPETYPKVFYPETPALYVLEVSNGEVEKLSLKVGDAVKFLKK